MKYQAVVFDLDGTLLNTLDDLADSVNFALQEFGYPLRTVEEVRAFIGNGVEKLIARAVPAETSQKQVLLCLAVFRNHYAENMQNKTCPYDGIEAMLSQLKGAGVRMAIVSNKFDQAVKMLKEEIFEDSIDVAIGESSLVPKKPDPTGVLAALAELGVSKEAAIYVGDSDVDIMTAKNAGIVSVGVTWGFRDRHVLENAGADYMIDEPKRLLEIVL